MTTVRFFAAARAAAGISEFSRDFTTLHDVVDYCASLNEALAQLLPTCTFLVDGITESEGSRSLVDVSGVDVLPKFAGG